MTPDPKERALTIDRFGSTFISDKYGERRIPPGTTDPYTGVYHPATGEEAERIRKGPSVMPLPRMPRGRRIDAARPTIVGHRDLQSGALEGAMFDLREQAGAVRRGRVSVRPVRVRFYTSSVGLVCAVLSAGGLVGFGCARPEVGDAGSFDPTPVWRRRVERELHGESWPVSVDELDEATGLRAPT